VPDGRKRIANVIAACGIATLSGSLLVATPSYAEPDMNDVQARVDRLYHQAEQASERYNDARVELLHSQMRLKSLRADLHQQEQKVESVRKQVASSVVEQYQGQALSTTSQVFLSKNPDAFLDQLATVSAYNDQQGQLMVELATQIKQLELREAAAKRELAELAKTKEQLARDKAEIDDKAGKAKSLLDDMKAEAQTSRSSSRTPLPNVPVSGRAGAAVNYAMAQVGDAYVYGASGPDAFDCSGLTMMAWAQAGVSLPHSASQQSQMGAPVSSSALKPGDLVFYYSPVSHVGIYIGNGKIVHAANPDSGVEISDVFSMPFSGARRFG
jgi:cell wall-associated NlpC family hydrolase